MLLEKCARAGAWAQEIHSFSRRDALLGLAALAIGGRSPAQPSATDWIGGEIVKINVEQGTVTIRHTSIGHLHLPAATTTFRYVNPNVILRIKNGDRVRFRADRYDGTLRLVAVLPIPGAS